ncbi:MAG: hypothetical protein KKF80_02085, partial [Candidatus Omnitrophica bacterium]|nr:hypothetical protein [Candidatus Omnitrophota bacterium]
MKSFRILCIGCLVSLLVGCGPAPKGELVIDDFEGALDKQTVDHGASSGSSVTISADTQEKSSGQQSMKIDFELKDNGYMWIARGYKLDVKGAGQWIVLPEAIDWEKYNAISVMVYGSNSGGIIAFDLKD